MKFITKKDLNLLLDQSLYNQLTCDNDTLLNQSEAKALEVCFEWLDSRYDMDFELRTFKEYTHSTVYDDLDRVKVSQSDSNNAFASQYGLNLISSGVESGITNDFISVKKVNSCELPYVINCDSEASNDLINYYYLDSTYGPSINNPDTTFTGTNVNYNDTCGEFSYSGNSTGGTITQEQYEILASGGTVTGITITAETYSFGEKLNYYNTIYSEVTGFTGVTTVLDYNQENLVNGLTPDNFVNNVKYFDQYLAENESRDFAEDDRNQTLIDIVASITIYELVKRATPRLMSETIADGYDTSIERLKNARDGKITLRLKEKLCAKEKGLGFGFRFGINHNSTQNKY